MVKYLAIKDNKVWASSGNKEAIISYCRRNNCCFSVEIKKHNYNKDTSENSSELEFISKSQINNYDSMENIVKSIISSEKENNKQEYKTIIGNKKVNIRILSEKNKTKDIPSNYKEGSLCWAVDCFDNGEKEMLHNGKIVVCKNNALYYQINSKLYQNLYLLEIDKILTGWSKVKYNYINIFDWGVANKLYKTEEEAIYDSKNKNSKERDSFIQTIRILITKKSIDRK